MSRLLRLICLAAAASALAASLALAAQPAAKTTPDARSVIAKKFPGVKPEDVRPSPVGGIYEVALGPDTAYVSADGRYIITGDLFEIDTRKNLTEAGRAATRVKVLAKLDERDMIVFKPATVKHTITVFTDVDCSYCRKLHSQIEEINKLGVEVRYAAYPRSGPDTDDWRKMEAVWCSKDRRAAITQAKQGQDVKAQNCGATPVEQQFKFGEEMGVRGTPAIFTRTGEYIGGYLPPVDLLKQLDELAGGGA